MMRNFMMVMLVAAGCGSGDPVDNEPDTIDEATKADGTTPLGNYDGTVHVGQIRDLTLNSDKSYDYFVQTIDCIPGPCQAQKGTYKFSHSSTTKYLRFYDSDGTFLVRYAWKLSGSKLSLRAANDSSWFYLTKTNLGAVGDSCGGFVANVKKCAEGLACIYKGVPDLPGTCEDPDNNPCVEAGGSCVALAPGSCDGEVGDARQYSCGGGLGVECCFPSSSAPSGPACAQDSDCSGILPDFCRVCSDNSTSCAHWSCEQNHCVIATCN
jgi:hypothetical protein